MAASTWGIYRLRFGVDFQDEGFYLGLPWVFSHGSIPFTQEFAVQQIASLLLIPLVKFYSFLKGSNGIVLAFRTVYFAFAVLVGIFCSRLGKQTLPFIERLAFVSLAWLFWPFSIPDFSYNTISSQLFTFGLFALPISLSQSPRAGRLLMAFAGASFFISILSYPTMILPVLAAVICMVLIFSRPHFERHRKNIFFGFLGFAIPGAVIAFLFTELGWKNILAAIQTQKTLGNQGGSGWKIIGIARDFAAQSGFTWPYLLGATFLYIVLASNRKWRGLIPLVAIASICCLQWHKGPFFLPTYLFIAGALFYPLISDAHKQCMGNSYLQIWIPSLFGGLVTAFTSSNGFPNAMIGCFGGALFSMYLAFMAIHSSGMGAQAKRWIVAGTAIFPIMTCSSFVTNWVYSDDSPIFRLDTRVESGPYAGLITNRLKAAFINELMRDLSTFDRGKTRVLFYDNFPGGYLFTALPNAGPSLWFYDSNYKNPAVRESYAIFFSQSKNQPDLVVELKDSRWNFYENNSIPNRDILTNLFSRLGYTLASDRKFYWLWIRP